MDSMYKIAAVAVLSSIMCLIVRQNEKATGLALSVLACSVILVLGFSFLKPIWSIAKKLRELSELSDDIVSPLFKVVGIGLLTQIAGSVCNEAGEVSLAKAVEITGSILSIYASLPLLASVLSLVEKLIGGGF